jgi:hypothetical protein
MILFSSLIYKYIKYIVRSIEDYIDAHWRLLMITLMIVQIFVQIFESFADQLSKIFSNMFRTELLTGTIPFNNSLLTGTVPFNNSLLTGTVPVNNSLLTWTVPVNKKCCKYIQYCGGTRPAQWSCIIWYFSTQLLGSAGRIGKISGLLRYICIQNA